jgi:hypothetical protein
LQFVILNLWAKLEVVANENSMLNRRKKRCDDMCLQHFAGFFANHDFAAKFAKQLRVSCQSSSCDAYNIRFLEAT